MDGAMRTFRLHKLVRDKVIQFTVDQGGEVEATKLAGTDFNKALVTKLIEEATELQNAELSVEELADLKEIIDQLCRNMKITPEVFAKIQREKRNKNGGFKNGDFIETVSLPADNKWAAYYASQPERFPEVK